MLQKAQLKPRILRRVVKSEAGKTRKYIIKQIASITKLKKRQAGKRVFVDMKRAGKVRKQGDTKKRTLFHVTISTQKSASIAHIGRLTGRAGVREDKVVKVGRTGINIGGTRFPKAYYFRKSSLKGEHRRIYQRVDGKPKAIKTERDPIEIYEKKGKRLVAATVHRIIKRFTKDVKDGKHYGNHS